MKVVLLSTYELGRQPFGLASPAAWLRKHGREVVCLDLSRQALEEVAIRAAGLVAFYVPMHTATRLAMELLEPVRELNPLAHICFFGLYAPLNEAYLRERGVETLLGGEFEQGLVQLAERLSRNGDGSAGDRVGQAEPGISLARQKFLAPDPRGLSPAGEGARVEFPPGGGLPSGDD